MGLQFADLVALKKFDPKTNKIDLNDRTIIEDPDSWDRLVSEGTLEDSGILTKKGLQIAKQVLEAEKRIQAGIPITERKRDSHKKAVCLHDPPWLFLVMPDKQQVTANKYVLYVGKPFTEMESTRASKEMAGVVFRVLRKAMTGKRAQVFPHSYQASELGGIEVIWLADDGQELFVPVQSMYFDLVVRRFPTATIWAQEDEKMPVVFQVKGQGKGGLAALVARVSRTGFLKSNPKKLDGWKEIINVGKGGVQAEGMPSLGEET